MRASHRAGLADKPDTLLALTGSRELASTLWSLGRWVAPSWRHTSPLFPTPLPRCVCVCVCASAYAWLVRVDCVRAVRVDSSPRIYRWTRAASRASPSASS